MLKERSYYFDSYAAIEMAKGSTNYREYADKVMHTSLFTEYEFFYVMLRELRESKALETLRKANFVPLEIKEEHIIMASKFKLKHRKKNLSYADCIGYVLALANNLKFLTGDSAFKDMKNVEFVK